MTKTMTFSIFLWMNLSIFSIVVSAEPYHVAGKRDPFAPLVTEEREAVRGLFGIETMDDLRVDGIMFDAVNGSVAIVNGEIVHEGEVYENLKVIKIQPNGVLFELNETQQFKSFGSDDPV